MPNIYEIVTEQILKSLEKGVIPWKKDWSDAAISWSTGKGYRGINALLVKRPGEYITFKQITENGGTLHKGAKSEIVVFYKAVNYGGVEGDDGEVIGGHTFMKPIRYYRVFNLCDVDGIAPRWTKETSAIAPLEQAENLKREYIKRSGIKFSEENQNRAYYRPSSDEVVVPFLSQFNTQAGYYGTLFHEFTHSTGAAKRLNRQGVTDPAARFGNEIYGREELVAEIGAAMLYSLCGLGTQDVIDNSAAYIKSWTKAIKDDPKMIVKAANEAQRAADYIRDTMPAEQPKTADEGGEEVTEAPVQPAPVTPEKPAKKTTKKAPKTTVVLSAKNPGNRHSKIFYALCYVGKNEDGTKKNEYIPKRNARVLENKYGLDLVTIGKDISEGRSGMTMGDRHNLDYLVEKHGLDALKKLIDAAVNTNGLSPRYTRPDEKFSEVFKKAEPAA